MTRFLVNGREDGRLDPADRGLHYGDGLFETLAVRNGRARFLDWHLERLAAGARRLGFAAPDSVVLRAEIRAACAPETGVVKLIVTRGRGERGYRPPEDPAPTRIVAGLSRPAWPDSAWSRGVRVGWCQTRVGRNPALAGIKHLNRLEQVLARREWDDGRMEEGLMLDERDLVVGGTQCNLFARIGDRWVTPALDQCGVAGVMRRAFRGWAAEQGDRVLERAIPAAELAGATALVLTNALIGAWPVRELAGRPMAVDPRVAQFNAWLERQ